MHIYFVLFSAYLTRKTTSSHFTKSNCASNIQRAEINTGFERRSCLFAADVFAHFFSGYEVYFPTDLIFHFLILDTQEPKTHKK